MTSGKRTTAFALAGAIALASGAYALGNEAGDGSAEAAKGDQVRLGHGFGPPARPRAMAAALAKELGLSTAKVRAALEQHHGPHELADALGVSEERLREAFHAVMGKPRRLHGPGRDDLAEKLGVTQAQLDAAFEKLRDDFAQELAERLNLDVAKVKEALEATPRFGGRRGP
jgi:hypothetical protein